MSIKTWIKRWWLLASILLAICPMGLLGVFRVTGVLHQPQAHVEECVTGEVTWSTDRPRDQIRIEESIENFYIDNVLLMNLKLNIYDYEEGYYERDNLRFAAFATANVSDGFVRSLIIRFNRTDEYAYINILDVPDAMESYNLLITKISDYGLSEDYVEARGINLPKDCSLKILNYWEFTDENNKDHWLTVALEAIYFNGTVYQKRVIPIRIGVVCDVGGTFDTAKQVTTGTYKGCLDVVDFVDMYKIYVPENKRFCITMTPPGDANCDLYLYDESGHMVCNSTQSGNATELIEYTASSTGEWYIEVRWVYWPPPPSHWNEGIYKLVIED